MEALREKYIKEIIPALKSKFNYKNVMQVPQLKKVVINIGVGEAIQNIKTLDAAVNDLTLITCQKPIITKAKKSIAQFKLRKGMPIGCCVTLRKRYMYEFLNKFVNITLPRVRDFKGVSPKGFDGKGNYTLGVAEQIIFPEINYDKIDKLRGMNITFVTSAKNDQEAKELLTLIGMPFRK